MLNNNFEIRVLVKGRPVNEYPHNGQTFIEGRDGSNFEIEFVNRTPSRVEAVLSVDGLSVIDGQEAGPESSGYMIEPYGNVRIPGWKLTDAQVAAFVFAGKKKSYAQQSTGSARNTGVIGALVFAEKARRNDYPIRPLHAFGGSFGSTGRGVMRGMVPMSGGWAETTSTGGPIIGASLGGASLNNMSYSTDDIAVASAAPMAKGVAHNAVPEVEQTLGTGFGSAQDFATTTVQFDRGDLAAMLVLYYDDSRGLRARGIELTRPSRQRLSPAVQPQAFPGLNKGCTPPPGWKG